MCVKESGIVSECVITVRGIVMMLVSDGEPRCSRVSCLKGDLQKQIRKYVSLLMLLVFLNCFNFWVTSAPPLSLELGCDRVSNIFK